MKPTRLHSLLLLLSAALFAAALAGCSPPFPKDLLERTDRQILFAEIVKDPARVSGKLVMLGGTIVETRNLKEGTQIEVLQRPLDGEGRPQFSDETGGRFIVTTTEFLDAAVYQRGRPVTFIAEGAGSRDGRLGEIDYRYPLFTARAVHLWAPSTGPRFSVGVGIYRGF